MLSRKQLAKAAGISAAHIRSLEHGVAQPGADVIGHLADALRCETDDLFRRVVA